MQPFVFILATLESLNEKKKKTTTTTKKKQKKQNKTKQKKKNKTIRTALSRKNDLSGPIYKTRVHGLLTPHQERIKG